MDRQNNLSLFVRLLAFFIIVNLLLVSATATNPFMLRWNAFTGKQDWYHTGNWTGSNVTADNFFKSDGTPLSGGGSINLSFDGWILNNQSLEFNETRLNLNLTPMVSRELSDNTSQSGFIRGLLSSNTSIWVKLLALISNNVTNTNAISGLRSDNATLNAQVTNIEGNIAANQTDWETKTVANTSAQMITAVGNTYVNMSGDTMTGDLNTTAVVGETSMFFSWGKNKCVFVNSSNGYIIINNNSTGITCPT